MRKMLANYDAIFYQHCVIDNVKKYTYQITYNLLTKKIDDTRVSNHDVVVRQYIICRKYVNIVII